jgi:hypothetical protein
MKFPSASTFYLIVIIALVAVIILLRSCSSTPTIINNRPIIVKSSDTVWLKHKDSIVYKPGRPIYIPADTNEIIKRHLTKIDTIAILKDYFAKYVYKDSIRIDSFGYAFLTDTITQNKIANRKVKLDYKLPVITNTTTITYPPKQINQVYAGFNIIAGAPVGLTYIGPDFTLKTKSDKIYSIGAGFNATGAIQFKFGTAWKIKLHK